LTRGGEAFGRHLLDIDPVKSPDLLLMDGRDGWRAAGRAAT
jgi:uncharacterized protein (DUF362 family)